MVLEKDTEILEHGDTGAGQCPVERFLDSLTSQQAKKIAWVLRLVEELDPVPGQYFRKLTNTEDIWEVRVTFGGDILRLLGFLYGFRFVVLVHGIQKKTQETPVQDIRMAEERRREYLQRRGKNK